MFDALERETVRQRLRTTTPERAAMMETNSPVDKTTAVPLTRTVFKIELSFGLDLASVKLNSSISV